jgi:hypothetical protein
MVPVAVESGIKAAGRADADPTHEPGQELDHYLEALTRKPGALPRRHSTRTSPRRGGNSCQQRPERTHLTAVISSEAAIAFPGFGSSRVRVLWEQWPASR